MLVSTTGTDNIKRSNVLLNDGRIKRWRIFHEMLINTPHSPFYTNLCRQTFCYPNNTMEYNIVLHAAMQWWIRKGQDCFFGIWKYGAHDRWKGYFRVFEKDRNILGRWVHVWCIPRIVIGKTDPWIVLPSIWKQNKTKQTTKKQKTPTASLTDLDGLQVFLTCLQRVRHIGRFIATRGNAGCFDSRQHL